jgi:hypothetical protein
MAARRARRLADGPLEVSAPAPAGLAKPAEVKAAPSFAAPAPIALGEPGEPARSLALLLGRVESRHGRETGSPCPGRRAP